MPNKQNIAVFYHPVSLLLLDDNPTFLEAMQLELRGCGTLITCTDPQEAMARIQEAEQTCYESNAFTLVSPHETDSATDGRVNLEITRIHQLSDNPARVAQIPVVIVDYQMPAMNGLAFCERLNENMKHQKGNIAKIMLTAEADKDTAIKAFNEGLIDKFILKNTEHLNQALKTAINDLISQHFKQLSQTMMEVLGANFTSLLNNSSFKKRFHETFEHSDAMEYYLLDSEGSFLFLDKQGNHTYFIIRSQKTMREHASILVGLDAPEEMINAVKTKQKLLFLPNEKDYHRPIEQWGSFLVEANKLDNNYYYATGRGEAVLGLL